MSSGRYFKGALGELSKLFEEGADRVARRTMLEPPSSTTGAVRRVLPKNQQFEHVALGHPGMSPQDLGRLMGTSHDPNTIRNVDIEALNKIQYLPRGVEDSLPPGTFQPLTDQYGISIEDLRRDANDPYFTVHSHPGGHPSPSITDLSQILGSRPNPDKHAMGVVGMANEYSPRAPWRDPRGSTVVTSHALGPEDAGHDQTMSDARTYLEEWWNGGHFAHAANDPYIQGMYQANIPVAERLDPLGHDRAVWDDVGRLGVLPPLLHLANNDIYHTLYDLGNAPSLTHAWDSNDKLEELYQAMKDRGHLDYADGGLV